MKAHGSINVAHDACSGRSFLRSGRADPPFSIRACGERVLVAASAAAPVGGDELALDIDVEPGARGDVGTVASTIVLPGAAGLPSSMRTWCAVAAGAHLEWAGEPTVSVVGSDHVVNTIVELATDATCRVVEEIVLGRTGEKAGRLRLALRVERAGRVLVHHDELFGPDVAGAGSVVSIGDARHVYSAVEVGPDLGGSCVVDDGSARVARLPVADDAIVVLGVGPDRPAVLAAVARLD